MLNPATYKLPGRGLRTKVLEIGKEVAVSYQIWAMNTGILCSWIA